MPRIAGSERAAARLVYTMASTIKTIMNAVAKVDDPRARQVLADIVATETERTIDRAVDRLAAAQLDSDILARDRLNHAFEQINNTNEAIILIAATLGELKAGQDRVIAATEEGAAQIKKVVQRLQQLESDTAALKQGQITFTNRLEELDQRHGQQWEDISKRLERDEEDFKSRLDRKRIELDELLEFKAYVRGRMLSDEEQAKLFADFEQLKRDVAELKRQAGHDNA